MNCVLTYGRSLTAERISRIFRSLQPVCPHEENDVRGLFHSLAPSPAVLLDAARTNKRGVTIFSAFAPAISFLLASDQWRVIHNGILRH